MDVIIMKVLLFCLLAAAHALVCDTGYYLNTDLQVCLLCTNGCTACCDENLCSTCDIGYVLSESSGLCDACPPNCE